MTSRLHLFLNRLSHERVVISRDGTIWRIGLRWFPRPVNWPGLGFRHWRSRRRKTYRDSQTRDFIDLGLPDSFGALVVIVAVVVALALAWFFIIPVVIFAFDILFLLLIAGAGILARVLLRRPWIIEATSSQARYDWQVVGWRRARRGVDEAARWAALGGSFAQFRPGRPIRAGEYEYQ